MSDFEKDLAFGELAEHSLDELVPNLDESAFGISLVPRRPENGHRRQVVPRVGRHRTLAR